MQDVIEAIVHVVGWAALKLVTLGRYRGGQPSDIVAEGGGGLAVIAAVTILIARAVVPLAAQRDPDLVTLTRDYYAALDRRDVAAVEGMLCDRAVRITPRLLIVQRPQMVAALQGAAGAVPPSREWAELTVHDLGATRLVTGRVSLGGPANAGTVESFVSLHWATGAGKPCVLVEERVAAGEAAEAAFWNEAFVLGRGFNSKPNAWLVEVASALKPGRALDVAMGQGRNAVWLAGRGWDVTGYDIAGEGLRIAREAAAAQKLKLNTILSSTEDFDFGQDQWDLVAIIYGGGRGDEIARAARGLKRGGHLVIEGFLGTATTGPGSGVTFDRAFLHEKARAAGLEVVRYEEPQARTDYGDASMRPVRFLARKN